MREVSIPGFVGARFIAPAGLVALGFRFLVEIIEPGFVVGARFIAPAGLVPLGFCFLVEILRILSAYFRVLMLH